MADKTKIQYINFYTDGSAARKYELPQPRKEEKTVEPQRQPRRKARMVVRVDPLALCSIAVSVVMLVLMTVGVVQFYHSFRQEQALSAYVQQLTAENQTLEETYRAGYDLEQIEQEALALGMIPAEQAQHITMRVVNPVQPQAAQTPWEELVAFFSGLFA